MKTVKEFINITAKNLEAAKRKAQRKYEWVLDWSVLRKATSKSDGVYRFWVSNQKMICMIG